MVSKYNSILEKYLKEQLGMKKILIFFEKMEVQNRKENHYFELVCSPSSFIASVLD